MLHTVTYAFNGDSQAVYFVFLVIQIRIDHCYRIWISVGFLLKDRAVDVVVEFFQIGYGKLFIFVAVPLLSLTYNLQGSAGHKYLPDPCCNTFWNAG